MEEEGLHAQVPAHEARLAAVWAVGNLRLLAAGLVHLVALQALDYLQGGPQLLKTDGAGALRGSCGSFEVFFEILEFVVDISFEILKLGIDLLV